MKINILAVYRSLLLENRGTPLRVKSLIKESKNDSDMEWHTCTLDTVSPLGLPHLSINHNHVQDILKIRAYVKSHDIDILVFHSIAAALYLPFLKVLLPRRKFVLEMHGFREEEGLLYGSISKLKYHCDRIFYGIIYRLADLITTCSETASERLRKYSPRVVTVYGGFDPALFNPHVKSGTFIKKDEGDIIVGYAGDGRKWQGLPFLLSAFEELTIRFPRFKLALLISEKRKIPDRPYIQVVDALPHERVAQFTIDCDILVIPRIHSPVNELGYPSKLMEYMAMGKPVVGSKTSDIHRIIQSGVNGMLFNVEDLEDFIRALETLENESVRRRIGEEALKTATEGYTWEVQGAVYVKALKNLMA